jgi:outer membrane protein assembly factor BamD
MHRKLLLIFLLFFCLSFCSKKEIVYEPKDKANPFELYKEAFAAFEKGDYFYAEKKFSEAELNFEFVEYAAKSAIMSSYSLYGINFYEESLENLNRYLKKYPADDNVMYAHYLIAIIHYEQIADEKKDMKPLINADKKIDYFIKEYSNSDYAIDLKFKKDLIQNQLAAKELYVAKYYIKTQKWAPAIKRLKIIVDQYESTIFIEEALHRLVEIYYHIGLDDEAKNYAKLLGYNYNTSEWFEQSYKVLNKNYKITKKPKIKKEDNFFKKIIKKIK